MVTRYEFLLYALGSSTPLRTVDLGKPTPDAAGTIRIALNTILIPMPAGGVEYEVRVTAIGSTGTSASTSSNPFAFAVPCTYTVSPTSRSLTASSGSSTFAVTAPVGCAWSASTSASWMTITGGTSGSGNGTVTFSVSANTTANQRSGTLTIGGQTVSVVQAGIPCTYSVSPGSVLVARAGGSASLAVTSPVGCTWSASEQSSWLSIASGSSGTGNGTVTFSVAANTALTPRSTSVTVAGQAITITQPEMSGPPAAPTGVRIVQ